MRAKIIFSYNGKEFFGSQTQNDNSKITVASAITHILKVLKIDSKVELSGRTDRGVHALNQVAHFDLPSFWQNLDKLKYNLNKFLHPNIHIKKIYIVDSSFHARFSAKSRCYRYIIKEGELNPFEDSFITFLNKVEFDKIAKNIELFIGKYDFSYFFKSGSQTKDNIREMYKAFAYKHKDYIVLHFEANGFLRAQVRLMVAALLNLEDFQIKQMLELKYKFKLKPAPSNGLYLAKIKY